METALTTWEAKERAGLLTRETTEWREKRHIAEDPNTTADVLEAFVEAVLKTLGIWEYNEPMGSAPDEQANCVLLGAALSAHPNIPLRALQELVEMLFGRDLGERSLLTKAVCRNPVLSLFPLELPNFWTDLDGETCKALLREETLLPSVAGSLTKHNGSLMAWDEKGNGTPLKDYSVAEAARLHVSQRPRLQSRLEGCKALTAFWKAYCFGQQQAPDWFFEARHAKDWHAEMAEVGLAPAWMTTLYGDVPPLAPDVPRQRIDRCAGNSEHAALVSPDTSPEDLMEWARTRITSSNNYLAPLLVCHPRVTVDVLRFIAGNRPERGVRLYLAAHPLTPSDALVHLVDVPLERDGWVASSARDEALKDENALTRRLACRHPNAPPGLTDDARRAFVNATEPPTSHDNPYPFLSISLVDFVTALRCAYPAEALVCGMNFHPTDWVYCLIAALHLPLSDIPLKSDTWGRSALDLMHHFSRHGNRFVRWAAQTRLADPDFVFTWQE